MIGRTVSHYEVTYRLGAGGIGEVFAARDTLLGRAVAIKVLQTARAISEESRSRFLQEARAASALNHPNIVTIHDVVRSDDVDCIVMELVDGETLSDRIARGAIPVEETLGILAQTADALTAAHARGIVHRDLKPGNIMITPSGRVKVLDFGLAKLTAAAEGADVDSPTAPRTQAGQLVGTPAYMSPEQVRGLKLDARSDIFSLGSIAFEMVTGRRAFMADSLISTIHQVAYSAPDLAALHDVPEPVAQLVTRMLERDPDQRVQTADEVRLAAEELRNGRTSTFRPSLSAVRSRPPWRRRTAIAATVLIVGSMAVGGMALWSRRTDARATAPSVTPVTASVATQPRTAHDHVRRGNELLATPWRAGHPDKAVTEFQRAIGIAPAHAGAHAGLAMAYYWKSLKNDDPAWIELALKNAKHATELEPQLAAGRVALGVAKLTKGDAPGATKELEQAIALDPSNAPAHRWLGEAANRAKDVTRAERELRRAVQLQGRDADLRNALGTLLYTAARYDDAAAEFTTATTLAPDNAAAYSNLAATLHQKGDYAGAARVLQRSLDIEPNAIVYANLGTLLFFQGLYPQSVTAFEKAVQLGANIHVIWANLGDAYRWTPGNEQKARSAYGTALRLLDDELREHPGEPTLLSRKALCLAKRGDRGEALRTADAIPIAEADPQMAYRLGLAYELAGARDKSLRALGEAVRKGYSTQELRVDPELTALRTDVRYQRMMQALR